MNDVTLRLEKDGAPLYRQVYAFFTQEIRAGRTMIVKTNDFETTGNIDSVDIADE